MKNSQMSIIIKIMIIINNSMDIHFKRQTDKIAHEKMWIWLRRGNHRREIESPLLATQTNIRRNNYIKTKINNTQQKRKCRICGERDETVYHSIDKCSKLVQKENKTMHDWVGKVTRWELCKRLKFDQMVYA